MRVCVAGLGVNGAAVAAALAGRGARVVGIDPHVPPHTLGSSHGITRILRFAYFEHPLYVPLVRRAHEAWLALEQATGRPLFRRTGALGIGPDDGQLVPGMHASARLHDVPLEPVPPAEARRRFSRLRLGPGDVAVYEPDAGLLAAEACVEALLGAAAAAGAELRTGSGRVESWQEHGDTVRVQTGAGSLDVDALVLATGPWFATTGPGRALRLTVERQPFFWYDVDPAGLPVILRETADGRVIYMAPGPGHRVKAALHHDGVACDAQTVRRQVDAEDAARLRPLLSALMPELSERPSHDAHVCLYTNSPDGHFVIDTLPDHARVFAVSACSGHGFKFAPAVAELVAARVLGETAPLDAAPFGIARLAGG